ncbi:alpha/beta fold hydrolase [Nonomuraea pusilla]|uniref:Pimeloyl-ACP methyl ester carboxylesterase n=1 Tax=Nonomuraea pusilla TaxID=46177 RepID=A0A1H7XIL9_9ACTN|nr:alpha/beta hydrolase [Nonomuraea pusilla]SEM33523.1 Pimeloyl-ACP methyl ester carboxylesterase [Nonomuraea pusilla]
MTTHHIWHTTRGEGIPLVMIHGYTIDHRLLLPLEPVFDRRPGWRRLYLDLPGHGRSPRLPGTTSAAALAEAVADWVADTVGDEPFAVLGQSFGGQIARAVTARFGRQVLGSALLAPVVRWGAERTLPDVTTLERDEALLAGLPAEDRDLFGLVMARLTRSDHELFTRHLLPGWRAHDRGAAAELEADFLLPEWPERHAPAHQGAHLLVTARQDALVGWEDQMELLGHYPHMSAAILDGAGHNPQVEVAGRVHDLVAHWLDALRQGA